MDGTKVICPVCSSAQLSVDDERRQCGHCGWEYPGFRCILCGRHEVGLDHLTPKGEPCPTKTDKLVR